MSGNSAADVNDSRSGHWRWRTRSGARAGGSVQPCPGRLPEGRGASAAAENGAGQGVRCRDRSRFAGVQALGGAGRGAGLRGQTSVCCCESSGGTVTSSKGPSSPLS